MKSDKEKARDLVIASTSAGLGAMGGTLAVEAAGLTAAGAMGSGAGIGCAAGPVGAAFGALAALAVFGIIMAVKD